MANGNYVSGAYHFTYAPSGYGAFDMGQTELGFEFMVRPSFNVIRADESGRTPRDGLSTGVEDVIIRAELIEYRAEIWERAVHFLMGGGTEGKVQPAGQLMSDLGGELIITPITGNATRQYTFSVAYPVEPVRSILSAQRLRTIPIGFYCFAFEFDEDYIANMYDVEDV